jgi:2-oxoglutarate dehydrogenase E1 component
MLRLTALRRGIRRFSNDVFLNGTASSYVDDMYRAWQRDPQSVHVSWQSYFKNIQGGRAPAFVSPPGLVPGGLQDLGLDQVQNPADISDHMKVQLIVRAYQVRGHALADLDPLGISNPDLNALPELSYKHYGFTDADLDRKFYLGQGILPNFLAQEGNKELTLREIIDRLKKTYCKS